jgi:3-dehydroquinate dehydratase-2
MRHFYVINGPNLNLLGQRDPDIYGSFTYEALVHAIDDHAKASSVRVSHFQSNHEGDLIDWLQQADRENITGVLLNAGAFTHYSYALHDAIEAIQVPVIEIHLSDISRRKESWRHTSVIAPVVEQTFQGEGLDSYRKGLDYLLKKHV